MPEYPKISQQTKQMLRSKGYEPKKIYEVNRLPDWAIPRTTAYNLTTLALFSASLAGLIITKRLGLCYQGFAICVGAVPAIDYLHRREIDNLHAFNSFSNATLEEKIEMYPLFKQAYYKVSGEMDAKIAELEQRKARLAR